MKSKKDMQHLHERVMYAQNALWKAYKDFAETGDMAKWNEDKDVIFDKLCHVKSGEDKEIAQTVKQSADFFLCGWCILVNEMKRWKEDV